MVQKSQQPASGTQTSCHLVHQTLHRKQTQCIHDRRACVHTRNCCLLAGHSVSNGVAGTTHQATQHQTQTAAGSQHTPRPSYCCCFIVSDPIASHTLEHTRRPVSNRLSATRAQAEKSTAFLFQSTRHPLGQLGQHQRKQEANLRPLPLSTTNSTKGSCCSLQQHQYRHNKLATLPGRPSPVAAAAVVWTHGPGFT